MVDNKIHVAQVIGRVTEGGVEKMITNLYDHIDHSKVVFDFYVFNTSIIVNKEHIEKLGGRVIIVPSYKHIFRFKKALKKNFLENKYDIVHVNMNAMSFFALKVAKKCGIKIRISHSHSSSNKKEFLKHVVKMMLRPFSKRYATHFFACSELAGKWLFGKKLYESGRVELINNAVDLSLYQFNEKYRKEIRDRHNIPLDAKVIGHVGRFCAQKNHGYLLDIFKELCKKRNDAYLLLVGAGEDFEKIKERVKNENVKNVIFTGPTTEVFKYYNGMDTFVLPSLYEGLPVVGVEAQANRLKCFFSTEVTSEAKLLEETKYIHLIDGPSHWAKEIDNFLNKNVLRVEGEMNNKYDINEQSRRLLTLYQSYLRG